MKQSSTVLPPQAETRNQNAAGAHLALVAVQLIFGTWPIVGKIALRELPSTGLVAFRVFGATAAFFLILRSRGRVTVPRRADLTRLALFGLLGVVLNQLFFVKGVALSTVVNAALIGTAIPVFTLLVGALFGFERLSARAALGTLVAAAGVVYLIDPLRADFSGGKALGNLLLVCSNLAYGSYIAVSRDVFRRYGALNAVAWVFAFACIPTIPLGGYYLSRIPLGQLSWMTWASVAYIVLVPTVGAYYLNALALERVAPSTVAVYIYLQPLVAFAVAPLLLGADEQWVARNWVAAALIFTGVAVVTLRARSRVVEEISERPEALGH
ncbi:MAG TPA: DMT family transporter [Pyrinomonadaceae bacterium]|nr:DMT family transporter [Pyrinomonadaceae bacterium]